MTTQLSGPQVILDPQIVAEQLAKITLGYGGHKSPKQGMCIMEAVSYIAGEQFSAYPECACPVITGFMVSFNDTLLDNAARDRWIKPLIPAIVGSRVFQADGKKDADVLIRRSLIAGDAALRRFVPFTLDIAAQSFAEYGGETWAIDGAKFFTARATWLRALPEQTSFEGLALAARTVFVDLADVADRADVAGRTDFYALGDLSALGYLADLADLAATAVRSKLVGRTTRTAFAAHTDIIALAVAAACNNLADLADSEQVNEARVATVLKMLEVQGEVFIANSAEKEEK